MTEPNPMSVIAISVDRAEGGRHNGDEGLPEQPGGLPHRHPRRQVRGLPLILARRQARPVLLQPHQGMVN